MRFVFVVVNEQGTPIGVYGDADGQPVRLTDVKVVRARLEQRLPETRGKTSLVPISSTPDLDPF